MLERILGEEGYEVVALAHGRAGLTAADTATEGYNLVVTNSHLPGMTGEQMVRELRRCFPQLPILHLDDLSRPISAASRQTCLPFP